MLAAVSTTRAKLYEGAGIVVGAGLSSLNTPLADDYHRRLGPQAGVMVDLASSYLRVELHYLQRGQYVETDVVNENGDFLGRYRDDMWADYLTVPVMVRFIANLKLANLFITAGPRMDILLGYAQSSGVYTVLLDESHFQPVNVGGNWGIGAIVHLHDVTVVPEVRMSYTFNDAYRSQAVSLYPSAIEAVLGIRF
ncbi:MAG TPA: outer membrane beta-barrel protein [bacterium]|nr:outer membrane beta-barrel protein [bacterium]